MFDVEFDTKKIQTELKKIADRATSDRTLEGIGDLVVLGIRGDGEIFDKEGIDSVLWPKSKAAQVEGRKTLHKSGFLRRSIRRSEVSESGPDEGGTVMIGTDAVYGAIHQFGGEAGRKDKRTNLPARPFLGITQKTEERIVKFIQSVIKGR